MESGDTAPSAERRPVRQSGHPEIKPGLPQFTIFPPLSRSQPAKRHSNRKRKANQSQLSVTSDPRVKEARQLAETLLAVTTEAVMIGLTDGELQMELAQWAGLIAESGKCNLSTCGVCAV